VLEVTELPTQEQIFTQLSEIQRALGTLVAESRRAEEDREHATKQREKLHERIDELRDEMHTKLERTEGTIVITGQIAAQARDQAASLKSLIDDEIKPQTDDYKRMRTMGSGFMVAVALAAGTLGIKFSDAVTAFVAGVKNALTGH
jgi:predicted  nucleic acid-binding Zn-ribbon protein